LEESGGRLLDEGEHVGDYRFSRGVDAVSPRPGRHQRTDVRADRRSFQFLAQVQLGAVPGVPVGAARSEGIDYRGRCYAELGEDWPKIKQVAPLRSLKQGSDLRGNYLIEGEREHIGAAAEPGGLDMERDPDG
jgi:hypothetical protein